MSSSRGDQLGAVPKGLRWSIRSIDQRAIVFYERHGLSIVSSEPNRVFMASKAPAPRTG